MNIQQEIEKMAIQARHASLQLMRLTADEKNQILLAIADALNHRREFIKKANQKDMMDAKKSRLKAALFTYVARRQLTDERIDSMIEGFRNVVTLDDPIGDVLKEFHNSDGLWIRKIRVPIGVIGMIYESRPNVTADVSALCIKTCNVVILRGGKESLSSNQAIMDAIHEGGRISGLPKFAVQLVETTDRKAVKSLVQLTGKVDLVIPRGGEELINAVVDLAKVPVIKHSKGLCHLYVDESADLNKALQIAINAKCQRPGVCNAMETLLVHVKIADAFLPDLGKKLKAHGVKIKGDKPTYQLISNIELATDEDWDAEYLELILSIKIVKNLDEAINHINTHGSHHSDTIIAESQNAQEKFLNEIDSAAVYVNASTRFTDGSVFGMGAEIGISTDKLHARGPMGLEELTTYKYIIKGNGQIRP